MKAANLFRRLANPKSVDNLTEEQYNNFGWVRANDVLNVGEWEDFTSKFAGTVSGNIHTPKTKGGEYTIAVSDIDDALHYGTDNIIVYAKGSIESPQVSRILKIDLDNETDLDQERRNIYEAERRGIQQKAGELRRLYFATDFRHWNNEQGKSAQRARNNSQLGADRGRGRRTTDRIKEFKVNDGSFTTTYADGRVVTEPPKVRRSRAELTAEQRNINADNADIANTIRKDIENATNGKGCTSTSFLETVEDLYGEEILMVYNRKDRAGSSSNSQRSYPTRPDGYKDFGYSGEQQYGSGSA